jgi:Flp pilus assembly protein TadG
MALLARLRDLRRDLDGAALVEFTLVAPVLISLMCGLAELGQLLRQYHVMEKGVRDAARYLTHVPVNPPCAGITDPAGYTWTQAVADAKKLAVYGSISGSTPLYPSWASTATVTVDDATCLTNPRDPTGAKVNLLPKITVTAAAPYVDLGMLRVIGLGPFTLTVSHQELRVF